MRFFCGFLGALLAACCFSAGTLAQPVQPPPTVTAPVGDLLKSAPDIVISNGSIIARIARIDAARGFYNGTRFDQAGVVTSLKLDGREFYGPWFEKTSPTVLDYTYVGNDIVAGPDSAISGPVEEFAPLNFEPRPRLFIKPGVGVLEQPDTQAYDHYRHYRIMNAGKRTTRVTKTSVTFTQTLNDLGYGYVYEKTLSLVPGKPQLLIANRLRNTGQRPINTSVYNHNFLRLLRAITGQRSPFPLLSPPPIRRLPICCASRAIASAISGRWRTRNVFLSCLPASAQAPPIMILRLKIRPMAAGSGFRATSR